MVRNLWLLIGVIGVSSAQAQIVPRQSDSFLSAGESRAIVRPIPRLGYAMSYVGLDEAYAINNSGWIAGTVGGKAALYGGGAATILQQPSSYTQLRADDIANSGRIVGSGMSAGSRRILYWENAQSAPRDIGAIARYMFPQSINSQGTIVGYYYSTIDDLPQGFRWSPTTGFTVITPVGATQATPFDVSDTGYVAGVAWYSGIGQQAVRWHPSGAVGRITGPAIGDRAFDDGSILGTNAGVGSTMWSLSNTATPVGPAPATHLVQQRNKSNRWVGFTVPGSQPWTSVGTGAASYLPLPSGALGFATDVNGCGTILGSVNQDGTSRPVIWTKQFCDDMPILQPF